MSMTKFLFVKNMLQFVIIVCAFLAVILLWSWLVLVDQFEDLSKSAMLLSRGFSSQNQEVRKINKIISATERSIAGFDLITPRILELIEKLPANIKLKSIDFDRCKNDLLLIGTAINRDALLQYEEDLRQITWVKNVDSPASQLLLKENINFELQITTINLANLPSCKK